MMNSSHGSESVHAARTCTHLLYIPLSGKFSWVQTFAKMPPDAPEEIIFHSSYFCDKALRGTVTNRAVKTSAVLFLQ